MTLRGRYVGPTLVSKILVFSDFTVDFWMKIPTLSPAKMQVFWQWQYKFYTDIYAGCVKTKRGHRKTVRLSTTSISSTVTRQFFRVFTGTEARPTIVSLGQWVMLANFKPKTPATARLSCCWMLELWQAYEKRFTWLEKSPVFRIQQSGSPTVHCKCFSCSDNSAAILFHFRRCNSQWAYCSHSRTYLMPRKCWQSGLEAVVVVVAAMSQRKAQQSLGLSGTDDHILHWWSMCAGTVCTVYV